MFELANQTLGLLVQAMNGFIDIYQNIRNGGSGQRDHMERLEKDITNKENEIRNLLVTIDRVEKEQQILINGHSKTAKILTEVIGALMVEYSNDPTNQNLRRVVNDLSKLSGIQINTLVEAAKARASEKTPA